MASQQHQGYFTKVPFFGPGSHLGSRSTLRWPEEPQDLSGQTAIITGSNTGIGEQTALYFASHGARVVLACRTATKAKAAVERIKDACARSGSRVAQVECMSLDLLSFASVRKFAEDWAAAATSREDGGKVDYFIANGGALFLNKQTTKDGLESNYQCNVLSHFLLSVLLLPYLVLSSQPKICYVSSYAALTGNLDFNNLNLESLPEEWSIFTRFYRSFMAYGQSKYAQLILALALQKRCLQSDDERYRKICITAVHPGMVDSDIGTKDHYGVPQWFNKIIRFCMGYIARTTEQGAMPTLWACLSDEAADKRGSFWADCIQVPLPAGGEDKVLQDRMWSRACQDVGLPDQTLA